MINKVVEFFKSQAGKIAILAFLLGALFGWIVIGWGLWPVTWTDAGFMDLQEDYAQLVMQNTIRAYAGTGDDQTALQTYLAFGEKAPGTYQAVKESGEIAPDELDDFEAMLDGYGNKPATGAIEKPVEGQPAEEISADADVPVADSETDTDTITTDPAEEPAPDNKALKRIGTFLGILFVLALIVGLVLVYIFLIPEDTKKSIQTLLKKHPRPDTGVGAAPSGEAPAYLSSMGTVEEPSYSVDIESASYPVDAVVQPAVTQSSAPRRSPIERTVNYLHNDAGRSHLEQNFSLKDNDDSGKTVLEYGIAMSDYVEIGGVTYALAFDVYLASHPERRTITRVMVNKDLLNHPEVLQRYEGKGEPIRIDQDYVFQLETGKFRLNGSIVNVDYIYDEKYGGNYIRELEVDLLIHYL